MNAVGLIGELVGAFFLSKPDWLGEEEAPKGNAPEKALLDQVPDN
jgi:hypothetical protein